MGCGRGKTRWGIPEIDGLDDFDAYTTDINPLPYIQFGKFKCIVRPTGYFRCQIRWNKFRKHSAEVMELQFLRVFRAKGLYAKSRY